MKAKLYSINFRKYKRFRGASKDGSGDRNILIGKYHVHRELFCVPNKTNPIQDWRLYQEARRKIESILPENEFIQITAITPSE